MDSSSVVQYEIKLKKLLTKFLEPGYRLGNDVYLNILLSHLAGKNNQALSDDLKRLPVFTEWISTAVLQWEATMTGPSSSISTFTLNLCSLISADELNFIQLNKVNIYLRLCKVLKLRSSENVPSVKLGYLKMLHSFMNHKSGLEWLVAIDHWNDILLYCLENQTIYITRDGYNFMYDLLSKFITINPTFCELIVKKIINYLEDEQFNRNGIVRTEVDDVQLAKDLLPTLKLVIFILEKSFLSDVKVENDLIPNIFIRNYNLDSILWKLLMVGRDTELLFQISKAVFIVIFIQIDTSTFNDKDTCFQALMKFIHKFFDLFNNMINKRNPINILKLCQIGHTYWKKISKQLPPLECSEPKLFENQLIIFQIMPLLYIAYSSDHKKDIQKDELTEMFVHKLFKISCENTIRCAYAFRGLLLSLDNCKNGSTEPMLFDFGQKAIYYLMKTRSHFSRDRAVIVFQSLMFVMKYLSKTLTIQSAEGAKLQVQQNGFLGAMFDGLSILIKDFKITWRESVETICLTSLSLDFLNLPNLPTKVAVQCLQLIHLSIANFMPPNLALLVDEVSDTSIAAIPPMLYSKLHDINWEIRDSALEILYTIVDIAHLKFPAFQKIIIDDHLCQLAVVLTTDDTESFVRASAIKCVTAMIRVPSFWNNCLEYEQLPEKVMKILQNETEAIVRCEAAKLMCEIYEHQYIPSDLMQTVYTVMGSSVTHDLHWEVKVNALIFWDKVINSEMSNQGMIDGVFPSVTFSKEHKKIVSLTEPEIQTRLNKVLLNLSECGCLGVLLTSMKDDCDLQVSRKSVEITKKLTDVLKKHNSLLNIKLNPSEINRSCWDTFNNMNRTTTQGTNSVLSENIIESIVNTTDMNLLGSVYNTFKSHQTMNGDVKDKELLIVKPEVFKHFVANDLDLMVDQRSQWLENSDDLNSLLDDILQSYEDNDVNNMDCY